MSILDRSNRRDTLAYWAAGVPTVLLIVGFYVGICWGSTFSPAGLDWHQPIIGHALLGAVGFMVWGYRYIEEHRAELREGRRAPERRRGEG